MLFGLCFLQLQVDCELESPELDSLQMQKESFILARFWVLLLVGVVWCLPLRSRLPFSLSSLSEFEGEERVELDELVWRWMYFGKSRALCGQCWQVLLEFCSMVSTTILNDDALMISCCDIFTRCNVLVECQMLNRLDGSNIV